MSRNLGTSSCCGIVVRLSDLRGKPVEFRAYGAYAPQIGVRWDCPKCSTAYFVIWRYRDRFWGQMENVDKPELVFPDGTRIPNREVGRFVIRDDDGKPKEDAGCFILDLSYYWSFNDEESPEPEDGKPDWLVEDDRTDLQWGW